MASDYRFKCPPIPLWPWEGGRNFIQRSARVDSRPASPKTRNTSPSAEREWVAGGFHAKVWSAGARSDLRYAPALEQGGSPAQDYEQAADEHRV